MQEKQQNSCHIISCIKDILFKNCNFAQSFSPLPSAAFLNARETTTTRKRKNLTRRERYISRMYVYRKHHGWVKSFLYRMLLISFAIFKPKRWYILPVLFRGELISKSMRSL